MDWPLRLCTTRLLDQHFGTCITPEDLLIPSTNNQGTIYYRPWKLCEELVNKDFGSTIDNTNDKFKISLDVQHFKPNEISVKTNDKEIIIEGKHEERQDEHGFISRQFVRRYALPKDCISESVTSTLSADGVLSIIASKKGTKEIQDRAKIISINIAAPCSKTEGAEKVTAVTTKTDKCEKKTEGKMKKGTKNECEMKKGSKTECEMKKETKNQCEIKIGEKDKKETQLMLREEHSRLLKPEFLGEAASSLNTEKLISESIKETDELMKLITGDSKTMMSAAAEKIDEVIDQCKTAISELKKEKAEAMSVLSEISNMSASGMTSKAAAEISKMAASEMSKMAASEMSSLAASEISSLAAAEISKLAASEMSKISGSAVSSMAASGMSKISESEKSKSSASELSKMSASEMSKMSASEMSSMAASEISSTMAASEMTRMATSEMSSMKSSMISETVEVTMSSSSSKTTSEATSETLSEKICAELKEAAADNT